MNMAAFEFVDKFGLYCLFPFSEDGVARRIFLNPVSRNFLRDCVQHTVINSMLANVFCEVKLGLEEGESVFLQNVSIYVQVRMAFLPRTSTGNSAPDREISSVHARV
jgi:hypothetical protein